MVGKAEESGKQAKSSKQTKQEGSGTEGIQAAPGADDMVYLGDVTHTYSKCGNGGNITLCRVQLRHNGRSILRPVEGPVWVGAVLSLRECVREFRRGR
jgi:ribosomal protein S28E/S33